MVTHNSATPCEIGSFCSFSFLLFSLLSLPKVNFSESAWSAFYFFFLRIGLVGFLFLFPQNRLGRLFISFFFRLLISKRQRLAQPIWVCKILAKIKKLCTSKKIQFSETDAFIETSFISFN